MNVCKVHGISGLLYAADFLSATEQSRLLADIAADKVAWEAFSPRQPNGRRVKYYGFRYSYRKQVITSDMQTIPLPKWIEFAISRARDCQLITMQPNQMIVAEYLGGARRQGITPHTDARGFGDEIMGISLNAPRTMIFEHNQSGAQVKLALSAGSLYVMAGQSRWDWKHSIPGASGDTRISVTLRTKK